MRRSDRLKEVIYPLLILVVLLLATADWEDGVEDYSPYTVYRIAGGQ